MIFLPLCIKIQTMQVIQNDVIKCCKMMSSNVVLLHRNNCCVVLKPAICEYLDLHVAIFTSIYWIQNLILVHHGEATGTFKRCLAEIFPEEIIEAFLNLFFFKFCLSKQKYSLIWNTTGYFQILRPLLYLFIHLSSHTNFCSVFLKWKWNSANLKNSVNQWGMNWDQFKDPVYYLCLVGTVVVSWSLTQEVTGSIFFF